MIFQNCVFCTQKQMSFCYFHQFCNMTKISVEIFLFFVYNVFIAVPCTCEQAEGEPFPKGE